MKFLITFFMVCLLEQDVGPDTSVVELPVIFYRCCRDIDIHTADRAILMLDAVDGFNALQNIFDRIIDRIFARLDRQPFMPHILKGDHLPADLLLRQFFPADVIVAMMVGTIRTSIYTVIRKVQRRKHHNPVSIKALLDIFGQLPDLFIFLFQITFQQDSGLPVGDPFHLPRLFQNRADQLPVALIFLRKRKRLLNLRIVDKFFCVTRFCKIHNNPPFRSADKRTLQRLPIRIKRPPYNDSLLRPYNKH